MIIEKNNVIVLFILSVYFIIVVLSINRVNKKFKAQKIALMRLYTYQSTDCQVFFIPSHIIIFLLLAGSFLMDELMFDF